MKLSVLLNNYNYGPFLGSAINSVLSQTYKDFQFIIVDDGSTDNSREIIAEYADRRIVTVFKENGGQGSAFKAGFAKASGDYVAFLDADDVWDAHKLERCVQVLRERPDVALLNHSFRNIDANSNVVGEPHHFRTTGDYDLLFDLRRSDAYFSFVPTSFFVGRLKECLQVQIDDGRWRIAADTPIVFGLGLRGNIYNLPEPLGSYRAHGANLWSGHVNNELLFRHFEGVYQLVNEEMERMGKRETFDFSRSELAMNYKVLQNSRYSAVGFYHRVRKFVLLRKRSINEVAGQSPRSRKFA